MVRWWRLGKWWGPGDAWAPIGTPRDLDERKCRINQLLKREKDWIDYQYDFGDPEAFSVEAVNEELRRVGG